MSKDFLPDILKLICLNRLNLAYSVITSVVHYRAARSHNNSNNNNKREDWCVLSLVASDNMNSPECNKATKSLSAIDVFVVSSSSSSSTSTSSSLDSLIHCDNNDNILPKAHFKSHKSTGNR